MVSYYNVEAEAHSQQPPSATAPPEDPNKYLMNNLKNVQEANPNKANEITMGIHNLLDKAIDKVENKEKFFSPSTIGDCFNKWFSRKTSS